MRMPTGAGRRALAAAAGAVALALLTAVLVPARGKLSLASVALVYLTAVVLVAATGGLRLALASAVVSDLLVNFFFVVPRHTLKVDNRDSLITLAVYVVVAVAISLAVDLAARRRAEAVRSGVESELLARITAAPLEGRPLAAVLEHVRETFGMSGTALLERDGAGERAVAVAGAPPAGRPALSAPAGAGLRLVAYGSDVFAADQRFFARLGAAAGRALEAERLAREAARARELAQVDTVRSVLLAAVGHDLRTPLAGIKAAVSTLREPGLGLTADQQAELLAAVDTSADKMSDLVENLLALSRLQAGVLSVHPCPVPVDEVVATALLHTPPDAERPVAVDVPDDLPAAWADPGLLERVIANLVGNALEAGPPGRSVTVRADAADGTLRLRVTDHGPGIPAADRERMFAPFQRLDDRRSDGLGLGLAIARGFTEAMDGALEPSDTPGGGLTMTVTLPVAADRGTGSGTP